MRYLVWFVGGNLAHIKPEKNNLVFGGDYRSSKEPIFLNVSTKKDKDFLSVWLLLYHDHSS